MSSDRAIFLDISNQGIARVEMDVPGKTVNLLSIKVLEELSGVLDSLQKEASLKGALFLSRKPDGFIGGADINVERLSRDPEEALRLGRAGRDVFQKIGRLPYPTVAGIHGACLGGGLELALACRYRIASDHRKTRLGLPEVMLGILPAWGGTTRLPRLVGLAAGLDLLLTGKQLDSRRAERIGLVDRVVTPKEVPTQAERFLLEILSYGDRKTLEARSRRQKGFVAWILNRTPLGQALLFRKAKKQVMETTKGRYPAPLVILKTVQRGIGFSVEQALPFEDDAFKELAGNEVTNNLLHVFSLRMQAGKLPPHIKAPEAAPPIQKVGVLGAGVMGAGIAQWITSQELPVRIKDINDDAVAKGFGFVHGLYERQVKRKKMTYNEMGQKMRLLSGGTAYSGFSSVDIVIEAVAEKMAVKQTVLKEFEQATGDHAIFGTNTSSLSVSTLAQASKHPDRVVGLHFFNPVAQMPLVEVVQGKQTSPEVMAAAVGFVRRIGKIPLITSDSPGFLVNRILMAYANEAVLLVEEGAAVEEVDRVMEAFGMPMGPLTMLDLVGMDIAHHAGEAIRNGLKLDLTQEGRLVQRLFESGRLGQKSGAGFYRHEGKATMVNTGALQPILDEIRKQRGITPRSGIASQEIEGRLVLIMIVVAAWCLENRVVAGPADVDRGMVFGAGFPPFRGGLLRHADKLGLGHIQERLLHYSRTVGPRFTPVTLLSDLARQTKEFYRS
jgi:3-hydroxyacyl-CoA dehydrogenase/enoyl-CoA hydratase/3-hydroxybutyryl-CoA epimerase